MNALTGSSSLLTAKIAAHRLRKIAWTVSFFV